MQNFSVLLLKAQMLLARNCQTLKNATLLKGEEKPHEETSH